MKLCIFLALLLGQCVLLSAQSAIFVQRIPEGSDIIIPCENEGRVGWSKQADRKRQLIFQASTEEYPDQFEPYSDPRYRLLANLSLEITKTLASDSGIYYCNATLVVDLQVSGVKVSPEILTDTSASATGGVSGVEREFLVCLSALFLFLCTVE
ncbi:hypothetical protein QTP70_030660 [Hemibagrus guttatus]|uniref:Immunoglobulin domain-containing protein n=1 Tax=Hemibagrus guttatus TaxID=175788 RepID=A0AAE0QNP8_9TELE|nr:hypothetical protein QTP70_030660 [Hemibagrus guttatus]KAK3558692.1 hypothetical protein QTP86_024507 [Hemibagrus guttatus]